jgi:Bardet-Biedl syndrome 7 protein
LKPLNLHERLSLIDQTILEKLPLSVIKITGKFVLADAHAWISNCLPEVPHHVTNHDNSEQGVSYIFGSTFLGSVLIVELKN